VQFLWRDLTSGFLILIGIIFVKQAEVIIYDLEQLT